jgi:hypothetical protein
MKHLIRTSFVTLALLAVVGAWSSHLTLAQTAPKAPAAQAKREGHPVLQNSIRQLEGVKDRLQKAPTDFSGHREAAVDAITHAIGELQQAIQADKK